MTQNAINRPPSAELYRHRQLSFQTHSFLGRFIRTVRRRKARRAFERLRSISSGSLGDMFPELSKARAVIQSAVKSASSHGNVSIVELILLSSMCALKQPKTIVEFGTYDGLTTLHLAMNSPPHSQIITLDLPEDDPVRLEDTEDTFYTKGIAVGSHFKGRDEARKIKQVFCDSREFDHGNLAQQIDFIFVDGGHAYDIAKSDSQKAFEMIRPGGMIFWHDYSFVHAGVYSCLNELARRFSLMTVPGTSLVFHHSRP